MEEAAATSTKIVQQEADVKHAEDEAVAAADKAAELVTISEAKCAEHLMLLDASRTTSHVTPSAAILAAIETAKLAYQAQSDAENAATAAAKDAAAKALAVPNMPQTQQRRQANLKHAQDEVDAAADKAAQLATVKKAKDRELRLSNGASAMDLERRTVGFVCPQTAQTGNDAHQAAGVASKAARAASTDKAAKALIADEHFAKKATADNVAPEEERTAKTAQVAAKQDATTAKADKVVAAKADKAAAKADKLAGKQAAKATTAAELAANAPFIWTEAEWTRQWNDDESFLPYWMWFNRSSKRPIDETKAGIHRAVWWWRHEMQHTKDAKALAALRSLKTRLSPADLQLILTVKPDTMRRSMLASD